MHVSSTRMQIRFFSPLNINWLHKEEGCEFGLFTALCENYLEISTSGEMLTHSHLPHWEAQQVGGLTLKALWIRTGQYWNNWWLIWEQMTNCAKKTKHNLKNGNK